MGSDSHTPIEIPERKSTKKDNVQPKLVHASSPMRPLPCALLPALDKHLYWMYWFMDGKHLYFFQIFDCYNFHYLYNILRTRETQEPKSKMPWSSYGSFPSCCFRSALAHWTTKGAETPGEDLLCPATRHAEEPPGRGRPGKSRTLSLAASCLSP